jgi:hypothetical protein
MSISMHVRWRNACSMLVLQLQLLCVSSTRAVVSDMEP